VKRVKAKIKSEIKSWIRTTRRAVIRTFYPFDGAQLVAALRALGVRSGDTLIAHSSWASFEGFAGPVSAAIQALQASVAEGDLMMPTLPFGGSALEYVRSGKITDIARTPSQMGLLSEAFRRMPGVTRSIHPTHPIAVSGKREAALTADHYQAETPCGKSSPFHRLLEAGGKILLAGVDIRSMTFFHYAEEVLEPNMPFSPFTKEWFDVAAKGADGRMYRTRTRLYDPTISARRDPSIMEARLRRSGAWHEAKVGRLNLIVLSAAEVLAAMQAMAREGRYCYRGIQPAAE